MKNIRFLHAALIATAITLAYTPSAQAIIINSAGTWSNPTGTASNVNGVGTNQISWGDPADQNQSSYVFTGNSGANIANGSIDGSIFDIGLFTHNNFPIYNFDFTGANLNIGLNIFDDAMNLLVNENFNFAFTHYESPNIGTCNPIGTTTCPDVVSIPAATATELVTLFGDTYELELLGFRNGAGNIVTEFITEENQVNTATLLGSLNLVRQVPEPSIIALLIPGFALSLLFSRRRKDRQ